MANRDKMPAPMSLEDYAAQVGRDWAEHPVALIGLDVLPDIGSLHTARADDSISSILGTSDPAAIGAFMDANGLKDSGLRAGENYLIPRRTDLADRDMTARGQVALNIDNARAQERSRLADLQPSEAVTMRPGVSVFDPQKGILATRPAADGLLSQNAQRRRPGFEAASDISGHMGRFIEGQRGVVKAAVDGGKEILGATDEFGTAKRVLGGLKGANIGLTVAGEAFGLADDLKRGVPARVAVPGAVAHGAASLGAGAMGTAAGAVAGQLFIPIPGVGAALGGAAGGILAGWAADKFGPTREHFGWELEKLRKGR